jgi:hypothetical protein
MRVTRRTTKKDRGDVKMRMKMKTMMMKRTQAETRMLVKAKKNPMGARGLAFRRWTTMTMRMRTRMKTTKLRQLRRFEVRVREIWLKVS